MTEQHDVTSGEGKVGSSQLLDLANNIFVALTEQDDTISGEDEVESSHFYDLVDNFIVTLTGQDDTAFSEDEIESSDLYELVNHLAGALVTRFKWQSGQCEDLSKAISLYRNALKLRSPNHPGRCSILKDIANVLFTRFNHSGKREDLDEAVSLYRDRLELFSPPHPDRSGSLSDLASALITRFQQSGQRQDLDEAVLLQREALELRPSAHYDRSGSLNNLANVLQARFEQSGQPEDLDEAISLYRDALELKPAFHHSRHSSLNNLAASLLTRFDQSGRREDLEEAILLHRDALVLQPASHRDRPSSLDNLAASLLTRFEQSGQHEDLDEAISLHRDALELRPALYPGRSNSLSGLANALLARFEQSGRHEDLGEAISLYQEALTLLPAPHPSRSSSLSNLADALFIQFRQLGQREDLDKAILLQQDALELLPAPHPGRSSSLDSLATVLFARFEQLGQREDMDKAISLHNDALELRPAPHPGRPSSLGNLAKALLARFWESGEHEYLDSAIALQREALELLPVPHPDRSITLVNLANALQTRAEQPGQHADLDDAIALHRDALALFPPHHPDRPSSLDSLALVLHTRFLRSGQHSDLDEAISLHQNALELRPAPHPEQSSSLNNLANALMTRFDRSGQREDLDKAISLHREALEMRPVPNPNRPSSLNNLASALTIQFEQSGQRKDLDEAINVLRECFNALVSRHPLVCFVSTNLGRALMSAYSLTHELEYLDEAVAAYRTAATCAAAPASQRFHAAKSWARHLDPHHESALEAYQTAIELLPRLAMLGLDLQLRQQALMFGSDGLARDAAACAIRSGQYGKAVELLEEGRAVFWSQALQLRTPMTDLRAVAPELEKELKYISLALEQGSLQHVSKNLSDTPQKVITVEQDISRFRRLNDRWLETLEKVRQLNGFQDFLRPNRLSRLQGAAANAPVVILNADKTGCAALILTSTGVKVVPLLNITSNEVTVLVKLVQNATSPNGRDASLPRSTRAHVEGLVQQMPLLSENLQLLRLPFEDRHTGRVSDTSWHRDDIFRYVLAVLWELVAEPIIHLLDLKKSDVPPNLWWCPTGPFAFLPIHAAGMYRAESTESVFDYVVSSYTPTISALLGDMPLPTDSFKMVVVIQPETPGQKPLPSTADELRKIEAHVPAKDLVKLVQESVQEVILHLSTASIVHFACHGQQNARNPLESALILQDGRLNVSQIMQQSMSNASLAFLSACETAMGDENLPDEAIHLGATLLFAGFHGVVATMWSISDADGPKVADAFYEKLFKEKSSITVTSGPDTTQAARALHLAVSNLRSEKASFMRWVPFIHLGR